MTIQQAMEQAIEHHQSGRIAEAEGLYRGILAQNPNHAQALNLLGVIAIQVGKFEHGARLIRQAIALDPGTAEFHNNLGNALRCCGRLEDAVAAYQQAIRLKPDVAEIHANLADTGYSLGLALAEQKQFERAIDAYRIAIASRPGYAEAHNNLGNAQLELGQIDSAIESYRAAIQLKPEYAAAHANLGNALELAGKVDDAIPTLQRAVGLDPGLASAHNNLGNAYRSTGKSVEAEAAYRRAIELKPDFAQAHHNLGIALAERRRMAESIAAHRQAVAVNPNWALAHFNLGVALLQNGEFEVGWREHEWRNRAGELENKCETFAQPQWTGQELSSEKLLIHAEQGFGDAIQFIRYLPQVVQRCRHVVIQCQRELLPLFNKLAGVEKCLARDETLPEFDLHCPLLSLPMVFGITLQTIPAEVPYLRADPELSSRWRERLPKDALKIGLAWSGRATPNPRRSVPLEKLLPLTGIPGITLISLQADEARATADFEHMQSYSTELTDFAQTAALIDNLDLVVSIDTAVAHLAGAMGKKTFVLLPHFADWRWLVDRNDSPWYPTMRLFRQSAFGDWDSPVADLIREIRAWVDQNSRT